MSRSHIWPHRCTGPGAAGPPTQRTRASWSNCGPERHEKSSLELQVSYTQHMMVGPTEACATGDGPAGKGCCLVCVLSVSDLHQRCAPLQRPSPHLLAPATRGLSREGVANITSRPGSPHKPGSDSPHVFLHSQQHQVSKGRIL